MQAATTGTVSRRTLRRQQKKQLIAEAQQDIDTIEKLLEQTTGKQDRRGLSILLDILYVHAQELINSEV